MGAFGSILCKFQRLKTIRSNSLPLHFTAVSYCILHDFHRMVHAHYLSHDAGVHGLDADVLAVQVQTVHEALCGPDQLVALPRPGDQAQLPLQIHVEVRLVVAA